MQILQPPAAAVVAAVAAVASASPHGAATAAPDHVPLLGPVGQCRGSCEDGKSRDALRNRGAPSQGQQPLVSLPAALSPRCFTPQQVAAPAVAAHLHAALAAATPAAPPAALLLPLLLFQLAVALGTSSCLLLC